jgi:lysyl-tRNA synthetase class 2
MTTDTQSQTEALDINTQVAQRREKLNELRSKGNAFPNAFRKDSFAEDLHETYDEKTAEELEALNKTVSVAGRMMLCRVMGKASFLHLQDMTGKIQLYVKKGELPEGVYEDFKRWDLGDILGAKGTVFKTQKGELSVKVTELCLLTKALQPLPDKFHGLSDQELRYRQRYVDLIANEEARKIFAVRFEVVSVLREFLTAHRFLEVETPMMHPIPGGAAAKPFETFHNALDMPLYLRIAPELYLKRLVVGGFERVFEINRNFRNEGISTRHNPEFTMVEFYQAYADYHDLMDLTEKLMRTLTETIFGKPKLTYQGETFDFSKPIARMTIKESIMHFNKDIKKEDLENLDKLKEMGAALNMEIHADDSLGKLQYKLFEKTTEHLLIQPIFITEFPTEVSPLARKNDNDPTITDRFEFFMGGKEIANGFSELNDSEDQAERFQAQVKDREAGDQEAMVFDADYINALEYGMPPTAGEGIGIDRLVMMFTDSTTIRDVILFPHMRPKCDG